MKYVFVSYTYSPGFTSPESWFKRIYGYIGLLECLSSENVVININQVDYEGSCLHNGVQHYFIRSGKNSNYFPIKLNLFVKKLKADIIVVQGLHHPLQVIQLKLLIGKKAKIIAQHHAEKPFTGIKKHIQRIADKCITAYLFASHYLGLEWVKNGNISSAEKIKELMEVSSNFYPVDRATAQLKTGIKGNRTFLWVGRLNENKDPLNVIKAFLRYADQNPSARLYMIYHTDELLAEINDLLNHHPGKNSIITIGKVLHEDLLYWYNSADFILSGSHYEGSGTAICEAMSCGCIPVVTDIFSFRMITDDGKCGILYEAGNERELFDSLMQTNQMDMQKKRDKCLEYFQTNLSFEAIAQQIQAIAVSLH